MLPSHRILGDREKHLILLHSGAHVAIVVLFARRVVVVVTIVTPSRHSPCTEGPKDKKAEGERERE